MNAKLCKRLRRQAEQLTVGKPARRLLGKEILDRFGGLVKFIPPFFSDPQSTRGVYRQLKREVLAAARRIA